MAAQHPASTPFTSDSAHQADIDAEAGAACTGASAPQPTRQLFGRHTALVLLAYGRDGILLIVTAAAKLLWRAVGGAAAFLLQHKQWLVRAPLEVLQLLQRLVRAVLQVRGNCMHHIHRNSCVWCMPARAFAPGHAC